MANRTPEPVESVGEVPLGIAQFLIQLRLEGNKALDVLCLLGEMIRQTPKKTHKSGQEFIRRAFPFISKRDYRKAIHWLQQPIFLRLRIPYQGQTQYSALLMQKQSMEPHHAARTHYRLTTLAHKVLTLLEKLKLVPYEPKSFEARMQEYRKAIDRLRAERARIRKRDPFLEEQDGG
ncbi:MAG: hypothetical protein ACTSRL_14410 [Candidatus Helarchaeota archaeon]